MDEDHVDVSVIIPIHNGELWIDRCFDSILKQQNLDLVRLEICVTDDNSDDNTPEILNKWIGEFKKHNISIKLSKSETAGSPGGVGFAKNQAVAVSTGTYLCFQDIDDIMLPDRVSKQFSKAKELPSNTLIGCRFKRDPEDSTVRYTKWANSILQSELDQQIYTSHGPTVIMPTWFCHRSVFEQIGGFSESGAGTPEDLIFFYQHLDNGGKLYRVDEVLLIYTYHQNATTFSIKASTIWDLRLERLERLVLCKWNRFTIWNAGRQGRKLYNSLSLKNRLKVEALCDIDVKKIGNKYIPYDPIKRKSGRPVSIIHFKVAKPPLILCVKMDLTNGEFEENLKTLEEFNGATEYVWFS